MFLRSCNEELACLVCLTDRCFVLGLKDKKAELTNVARPHIVPQLSHISSHPPIAGVHNP